MYKMIDKQIVHYTIREMILSMEIKRIEKAIMMGALGEVIDEFIGLQREQEIILFELRELEQLRASLRQL